MTTDPVRAIADAVLYEGYLLWPYRRSALKNQQRFTFGGVYPPAFTRRSGDRAALVMECLLEGSPEARVEVAVRHLQLVERQPVRRIDGRWHPVDELTVDGQRYLAFEEAIEREHRLELDRLSTTSRTAVEVAAGDRAETLSDDASLLRRWQPLEAVLEVASAPIEDGVVKLSARFENRSSWPDCDRREALARTFLSTHLVARCRGAAFVSQTDPPESLRETSERCVNDGVWPVLVGEQGERQTMLGSPIILPDYPSVAPESPGQTFDNAEIDALLLHSIRALTDHEREEMQATDPRSAELLERSLALGRDQLISLHGAIRETGR